MTAYRIEMPHPSLTEEKSPRFIEVALPVPLEKLFTYRIPNGLSEVVRAGARVLVPFGKQTLTGYVANIRNDFLPNEDLSEDEVKEIIELQDEEPLVTPEILELTKWAAQYYASSWGEMLKASLPAGINAATERIVSRQLLVMFRARGLRARGSFPIAPGSCF